MKKKRLPATPVYAEKIILSDLDGFKGKILDYGSGYGDFTNKLVSKEREVYGVDTDSSRVAFANSRYHKVDFRLIKPQKKLPFRASTFDCVILFGVLEHVPDEKETLGELHRVLKKGGLMYIYGLHKGLLEFCDAGNLKFRFPGVHKFLYKFLLGKKKFNEEFGEKEGGEMYGDFSAGKNWHTHYSQVYLQALSGSLYEIKRLWLYGMFEPILRVLEFLIVVFFERKNKVLSKIISLDSSISYGKASYNFVAKLIVRK